MDEIKDKKDHSAHIKELSDISKELPKLLEAAGKAVNALTNRPLEGNESQSHSIDAHKAVFEASAKQYFTSATSISQRLRVEAQALQKEGLISPSADRTGDHTLVNGGMGNLDIGWLNSRGDQVDRAKAVELSTEIRQLLEQQLKQTTTNGDHAVR